MHISWLIDTTVLVVDSGWCSNSPRVEGKSVRLSLTLTNDECQELNDQWWPIYLSNLMKYFTSAQLVEWGDEMPIDRHQPRWLPRSPCLKNRNSPNRSMPILVEQHHLDRIRWWWWKNKSIVQFYVHVTRFVSLCTTHFCSRSNMFIIYEESPYRRRRMSYMKTLPLDVLLRYIPQVEFPPEDFANTDDSEVVVNQQSPVNTPHRPPQPLRKYSLHCSLLSFLSPSPNRTALLPSPSSALPLTSTSQLELCYVSCSALELLEWWTECKHTAMHVGVNCREWTISLMLLLIPGYIPSSETPENADWCRLWSTCLFHEARRSR